MQADKQRVHLDRLRCRQENEAFHPAPCNNYILTFEHHSKAVLATRKSGVTTGQVDERKRRERDK